MDGGRSAEAVRALDELDRSDGVDEISRARAEVCRGELELGLAPTREIVDRLRRTAGAAIDLFAANDEEQALVRACWLLYLTSMILCRAGTAREAIDRLISVSGRFSDPLPSRLPGMLAMNLAWGPTPVPAALAETESILRRVRDDPAAEPRALGAHAYLLAQDGAIAAAREALARMREIVDRHGQLLVLWSAWGQNAGRVELLAGDPAHAERALRPAYEGLVEARQFGFSCTVAGQLAHALVDLGRPTEAAEYAAAARDAASEADLVSQILWRSALARALALRGEGELPLRARRGGRRPRGDDRVPEPARRRAARPGSRLEPARPPGRRHSRARGRDIRRKRQPCRPRQGGCAGIDSGRQPLSQTKEGTR